MAYWSIDNAYGSNKAQDNSESANRPKAKELSTQVFALSSRRLLSPDRVIGAWGLRNLRGKGLVLRKNVS
ncbi:hypothetical protein CVT25_005320 [Psilocybe cyanescens]|uniref:Uncharacterized protein n=1 Tax=Psilocybe cyanescens TaxID=93625 RepID=A0A409VPQ0_PSICY|nr:hypothetical protein CVT25_005320 [Psilocybe cyanescens]